MSDVAPFLTDLSPGLRAVMLGMLGAILGSFIAAVVIRWPQGRSVIGGRSRCDSCEATLGARDLVPLLSAVVLRGKCRHCGVAIDPLHLRIEMIAVAIGVVSGALLPGIGGPIAALFGWLLLAIAALDATEFWLPDELTAGLAIAGLAIGWIGIAPTLDERLIGGAAGFASLWVIAAAYCLIRGREGLGGGDPKLLGAIGLWVGWRMLPQVVLIASLVGFGVVLFRHLTGQRVRGDTPLPFGTLLAIAAYPVEIVMLMAGA